MLLRQIFDPYLAQYAYLIGCQKTGEALIIDPERDIDQYHTLATENGLQITAVAETHIHADFVSGAQECATDPRVHLYLSDEGGSGWAYQWPKGRANTHLLKHGDTFMVGKIRVEAVHTPGHTPEHISFLITDLGGGVGEPMALATGDFLFVGDVGRPDLLESAAGVKDVMEPSARTLRASLAQRLAPYSEYLQILPGHGAGSACGKSLGAVPTTTLGYERRFNAPLKRALANGEAFVKDILQGQPDPPLYFATMKRVNRDGIAVTGGIPHPVKLSAPEFASAVKDSQVKVLDTRKSREEFDAAHVPHAILAPLHSAFFSSSAGSFLTPDDQVILMLERSEDSDSAVRQLYRIGFDRVAGWITLEEAQKSKLLTESTTRVRFDQFDPRVAGERGVIVDVRTTAEYQSSHLPGATSMPYTRLRERVENISRSKQLFVHCASGYRAALASSFLQAQGFDVVHVDGAYSSFRGPTQQG